MRTVSEDGTTIKLLDRKGKLKHSMVLVVAKSGAGKTILSESIAQEYYEKGKATVIILGDPKKQNEWCFQGFYPTDSTHLRELKKVGKPPHAIPIIHYEPFSFAIPRHSLPKINFYTLSIKDLLKTDFQAIVETEYDSEIIRLLYNTSRSLKKSEGLYAFMDKIKEAVDSGNKKTQKEDPESFFVKSALGNKRSLGDIASYMLPFKDNYFLANDDSRMNLNWNEILNDNSHYHVFNVSYWVEDEKIRELITLFLLNGIMNNQHLARKPVLIVIPEIRKLCPVGSSGYKKFISIGIKNGMTVGRSSGKKGFSFLLDSQTYMGIDLEVRNSSTINFFGELGGLADIDKVCKSLAFSSSQRSKLSKMEVPYSFICNFAEKESAFKCYFPSGAHCEEHSYYFDDAKKYKPDEQQNYTELIKEMRLRYKSEFNEFKDKTKQKQDKESEDAEINLRKTRLIKTKDFINDGYSAEQIAIELNVSTDTAKNYMKESSALIIKEGGKIPILESDKSIKKESFESIVRLICLEKIEKNNSGEKCSLRDLAKKYNISHSKAQRILRENLDRFIEGDDDKEEETDPSTIT